MELHSYRTVLRIRNVSYYPPIDLSFILSQQYFIIETTKCITKNRNFIDHMKKLVFENFILSYNQISGNPWKPDAWKHCLQVYIKNPKAYEGCSLHGTLHFGCRFPLNIISGCLVMVSPSICIIRVFIAAPARDPAAARHWTNLWTSPYFSTYRLVSFIIFIFFHTLVFSWSPVKINIVWLSKRRLYTECMIVQSVDHVWKIIFKFVFRKYLLFFIISSYIYWNLILCIMVAMYFHTVQFIFS